MANNTRKTRAAKPTARYRFPSASDAKAVEELMTARDKVTVRTGKFLTIVPDDSRTLGFCSKKSKTQCEPVLGRGRPRKDADAKPASKPKADAAKKTGVKSKKKSAGTSATRIASSIRKAAQKKRDASEVVEKLPAKYKAGAAKKSARPEAKRLKKPSERTRPVWVLNVKSSNIEKALYNVEKKRLTLVFLSGKKYVYEAVTLKEFMAFTTAESQGEYFAANIKPVKSFRKIED